MKRLAAVLVLMLAFPIASPCQDLSFHVTVRSFHFQDRDQYEQWNLGFGVGIDVGGPGEIEIGGYRNSENNFSPYAIYTVEKPDGNFGVVGSAGVVSGYGDGPRPLLSPGAFVGKNPRLRFGFLPTSGGVIFTQIKFDP